MNIFLSPVGAKVIFILGITNLIMALLILFSCRCLPMSKRFKGLMKYKSYQTFYKYHCYFWWIFWVSVVTHIIFAVMRLGIPF